MTKAQHVPGNLEVRHYRGKKRTSEGSQIAHDRPIISGLSGSVTITVYAGDSCKGYTRTTMDKETARQLSAQLLDEVERQDRVATAMSTGAAA